ncbi:MAG: hypothetical protein KJ555_09365, partial [Proteobacteria bacterium]|nr:hypothetical protein [Pseudomonadota bacterium]
LFRKSFLLNAKILPEKFLFLLPYCSKQKSFCSVAGFRNLSSIPKKNGELDPGGFPKNKEATAEKSV